MNGESPQDLMRLVQEGDEEAFRELVRRFREPVVSFAMRLLNDQEKALDVAQETFINVFTHAASYRPVAGFTAWLYRIAYNLAITEIRKRRRQPTLSIDSGSGADGPDGEGPRGFELPDGSATVEQSLIDDERRAVVGGAWPPCRRATAVRS